MEKLETYSSNVQSYITEKIDRPFYEAMDKVGASLEALNIANYTTGNIIGFKKTIPVVDGYGKIIGTQQKLVKEVGLRELYKVDNPYKKRLQASYEAYKTSDAYKQGKLSEEEYMLAHHQTRAFAYQSISDDQAAFEGVRDLALGAGVVILTIFCPPAGAVVGVALASADMYSAAVGKDWGTGRQLDKGERLARGAFALFDLVPGVGYVNDLAKAGKLGGATAIKAGLKSSIREGLEQGAKNVDNLKHLTKNLDNIGKNVVKQVDNFGKQVDNLVTNKVSSLADNVAGKLRHADETLSTAAQNFRLNIGLEPQLIDGFMPTPPPGKLSGLADNIQAFAKNLDGSVDEVVVPSVRNNEFNKWFDDLSSDEFEKMWNNPQTRKIIEDRIRKPGGYHEWHLVSRTPTFKRWGVSMDDIKEMRTLTKDVEFINPPGRHGGRGSTMAHNEILRIIDSSKTYEEFVVGLNEWATFRMKNGILDLPLKLRR